MTGSVTVLYLGGAGRSGSTLLERMLGEVAGVVSVGEVVHLVERGLIGDELCGCGDAFSACPFWDKVGRRAFGGWSPELRDSWLRDQHIVDRNRHLLALLAPIRPGFRRALKSHRQRLGTLYAAIAEVSGVDVVVDSSKHVSTALVLRRTPGIHLHLLHLVRDSRGVAYSWTKEVSRPEVTVAAELMPRFRPAISAAWWTFFNLGFDALRLLGTPTTFVRYEDLLRDPKGRLGSVLTSVGVPTDGALDFIEDGSAHLGSSHSVAGNPMRFTEGRIELRADEEWRSKLDARSRRIVTALTAPLLLAYGYLRPAR